MNFTPIDFRFEFVERVPRAMEPQVLYISLPYNTTMHICPCGCGKEVANKLSPSRWSLHYDGETVSLKPSVRNTGLPCQSHYFITRNRVEWAYDSFEDQYKPSGKKKKGKKKFRFF